MGAGPVAEPSAFDCTVEIPAPPEVVLSAFFSPDRLREWWQARASITTPCPLGIYAIEWPTEATADPVLGRLGGAFYGVVIDVRPGRGFFLADAYWLPPDGDPIGPMALHVTCDPAPAGTRLRVEQSGCDDSARWRRFYRVFGARWIEALARIPAAIAEAARAEDATRPSG